MDVQKPKRTSVDGSSLVSLLLLVVVLGGLTATAIVGVNGLTALIFGRWFDRIGVSALVLGIFISLLALPFGFLGGAAR